MKTEAFISVYFINAEIEECIMSEMAVKTDGCEKAL